ncbi:MAG: hypothetical protein ACR2LI_06260 [Propionibacteriaceae bacterium]
MRPIRLLAVATLLVVTAAGCSTPPWQVAGSASPSADASATPTPTASGTPKSSPTAKAVKPVKNDLATGSAHSTLSAGAVTMKVDYWSNLSMAAWTPAVAKPLNMSLTATLDGGADNQGVFITKVSMVPTVTGPKGVLQGPAAIVDQATTTPGYSVRKPQSYSSVFTIPALDTAATSVSLSITYEMVVQTAPKSKQYSKQTASDSLSIVLA